MASRKYHTVSVNGFIAWNSRLVGRGLRDRIRPSLGLGNVNSHYYW